MDKIRLSDYKKIVFFTGAGVSVPSGIRPFRGENGMWNEIDIEKTSSSTSFTLNPNEAWKVWGGVKNQSLRAKPNLIHNFMTEAQKKYKATIITQNVDALHTKSGSKNVIELHGSLDMIKCSNHNCNFRPIKNTDEFTKVEYCNICGSTLRPDIILFGEMLKQETIQKAAEAASDCDILIAMGSTCVVTPASDFIVIAGHHGARTILINRDEVENRSIHFDDKFIGKAEEIIPSLFV